MFYNNIQLTKSSIIVFKYQKKKKKNSKRKTSLIQSESTGNAVGRKYRREARRENFESKTCCDMISTFPPPV